MRRVIGCEGDINTLVAQETNSFCKLALTGSLLVSCIQRVNCHRFGIFFLFMCHGLLSSLAIGGGTIESCCIQLRWQLLVRHAYKRYNFAPVASFSR